MKIERKDKKDAVTFSDLIGGTVFEYKDNVYIKIPMVDECFNAMNMNNVTFVEFFGNEVIRILEAKLVIE